MANRDLDCNQKSYNFRPRINSYKSTVSTEDLPSGHSEDTLDSKVMEGSSDLNNLFNVSHPTNKDILNAIAASNLNLNSKIDSINRKISELESDNAISKAANKRHEAVAAENTGNIIKLQQEIVYLKQKEFDSDVIISGLPIVNHMSCEQIVQNLDKLLDFGCNKIHWSFLKKVYRNNEANHTQLIARFRDMSAKEHLLRKLKINGPVLVKQLVDLEEPTNDKKVFIGHRLTHYNSALSNKLRGLKRENKINDTWYRNGHLYVKFLDDVITRVSSMDDVAQKLEIHNRKDE